MTLRTFLGLPVEHKFAEVPPHGSEFTVTDVAKKMYAGEEFIHRKRREEGVYADDGRSLLIHSLNVFRSAKFRIPDRICALRFFCAYLFGSNSSTL